MTALNRGVPPLTHTTNALTIRLLGMDIEANRMVVVLFYLGNQTLERRFFKTEDEIREINRRMNKNLMDAED